jgi:hypothetical protein
MNAKERTIMNKACSSIIGIDWRIKFVGIIDLNGKLLIGKGRVNPSDSLPDKITIDSSSNICNSTVDDIVEVYFKHKNMYLFYYDYLLWIIQKFTVCQDEQEVKYDFSYATENSVSYYFEVSGCSEDDVKLTVTSLDLSMRRFLCIYFDPAYSIRSSIDGAKEEFKCLLSKVIATIS